MRAFIGGTGLTRMVGLEVIGEHDLNTRWGSKPAAPVIEGRLGDERVLFLARHGDPHVLLPHEVNYRANLAALSELGATEIIAVNAVGGITEKAVTGALVVPDQIIDYTWGRDHSFFDNRNDPPVHVDFTWPFDSGLRRMLCDALAATEYDWTEGGVYGATQGPRLETAAEIVRMERDGCDIVGMTGMPEAVLARELAIPYAMLSLVVNPAAGKSDREITMAEIEAVVKDGMGRALDVLAKLPPAIRAD